MLWDGHRVKIDDAVEDVVVLVLQPDPVLDGSEVVPDVWDSRGLNPRQNARRTRSVFGLQT